MRAFSGVVRTHRSIYCAAPGILFWPLAGTCLCATGQPGNNGEPFENMRDHAIKMENDNFFNGKRKPGDDIYFKECKRQLLQQDYLNGLGVGSVGNIITDDDLLLQKRSDRSCKGKKYQEFINSGQITTIVKRSSQSVPELPAWPGAWQAPARLPGQAARPGRIFKF